jgi:hypothetical protein
MSIKIVSAWSAPGGSTVAHINLCNLLNESGYDCTFYGPHGWQEHHCQGASIDNFKVNEGDHVIAHFLEMGSRPKTASKIILSCHETNLFPLKGKKKFWDDIQFVSESQKEWHGLDGVVIPNVITPLENHGGSPGVAGVIGSVDSHKQTHMSISRALSAGYKKVLVYGLITDQEYYMRRVRPLEGKRVLLLGHLDDKQKMYDSVEEVFHSSKRETFNFVKFECEKAGIKYNGLDSTLSSAEIKTDEEILEQWKTLLGI